VGAKPRFKREVEQARRTGVDIVVNQLVNAATRALDSLIHVASEGEFESSRVAAAGKLLNAFTRLATANEGVSVNVSQTTQVAAVATTTNDADSAREYILAQLDKLNHTRVAVENQVSHTPGVTALAPVIEAEFETVAEIPSERP
jgi:phage-related tail protein